MISMYIQKISSIDTVTNKIDYIKNVKGWPDAALKTKPDKALKMWKNEHSMTNCEFKWPFWTKCSKTPLYISLSVTFFFLSNVIFNFMFLNITILYDILTQKKKIFHNSSLLKNFV